MAEVALDFKQSETRVDTSFIFYQSPGLEAKNLMIQLNPTLICDPGSLLSILEASEMKREEGEEGQLCLNLP